MAKQVVNHLEGSVCDILRAHITKLVSVWRGTLSWDGGSELLRKLSRIYLAAPLRTESEVKKGGKCKAREFKEASLTRIHLLFHHSSLLEIHHQMTNMENIWNKCFREEKFFLSKENMEISFFSFSLKDLEDHWALLLFYIYCGCCFIFTMVNAGQQLVSTTAHSFALISW